MDNDECRMPRMDVEFPSGSEIKLQKELILNAAMPKRKSVWEKLKQIYWGPGLKTIFHHCGSAWLVTAFVYACVWAVCQSVKRDAPLQMGISVAAFPICYFAFSFISCWVDEQEGVIELKNSLHYSAVYIVSLRMFYSSIAAILSDMLLLSVCNGYRGQAVWKLGAAGISSMFLSAAVSLYLYHKTGKSRDIGIFMSVWSAVSLLAARSGSAAFLILFGQIPLAVHFAVSICCFAGFLVMIQQVCPDETKVFTAQAART